MQQSTLYEFAGELGGNRVDVVLLFPPGSDHHTWEPKPSDIKRLADADIFLFAGAGLEPWVEQIKPILKSDAVIIEAGELVGDLEIEHQEEEHEGEEHETDPHFWLDFENDLIVLSFLKERMAELSASL